MKKIYKLMSVVALSCMGIAANAQTYCVPYATSTADDEIRVFQFAGISNTTACLQAGTGPGSISGYANYTGSTGIPNLVGSIPAGVAIMGMSYTITAGLSMCNTGTYSGSFLAFIDFNQDGDFIDPGELVWTSAYGPGLLATTAPGWNLFVSGGITIPFSATPGLTRMRIWESETSVPGTNPCANMTWGEVEDYIINIVPPTPCTTTPPNNTVVATTNSICPNTGTPLSLATSYTLGGITYTWQYSTTSALGPYTVVPVSSASTAVLSSPNLTVNTYFQLVTSCINGGSQYSLTPVTVSVSPVIINNVPYYEGFEGILTNNQLPNCSWTSTGGNAQTYTSAQANNRIPRTGNKFASVYGYNLNGTNYYYSNGIQMYPGITYSASVFWTTEYFGYTNFQEFSIKLGTSQSPAGLVNIATQSVAASPVYKQLDNTFTVPTAGIYYVAIKIVSAANANYANYLSWDDLSITIPCQLNTPTVAVTANNSTICAGTPVLLTATGANTYTWNTGVNTSTLTDTPGFNTTYVAVGTNTLTNCSTSVTKNIFVNQTPVVSIAPSATAVCEGSPVNLTVLGATSYTWSVNANTSNFITVSPVVNTLYSVTGGYANSNNNCTGTASQLITVNSLPNVVPLNSPANSCAGQNVSLSATGATSFEWLSNTGYIQGSPVIVNPTTNTTYSLTGTDENGCEKTVVVNQVVSACLGVNEQSSSISGLSVYPNPTTGEFVVELNNGSAKTIEVMDVTGRVLSLESTSNDRMNVNINNLASGVYYVKVKTNGNVDVLKIVKQ